MRPPLFAGMRLILPSGNLIELIELIGDEWTCVYVAGKAKGEVAFTAVQLRRWIRSK